MKYGQPLINVGKEVDCQVQAYIKDLREAGTPVNTAIVIATGKGIVMDKTSDTFNASPDIYVYLTKDWAKYLMKRMEKGQYKGKDSNFEGNSDNSLFLCN